MDFDIRSDDDVTLCKVVMNRTHNGPMIKGRSQGNATVSDILFEDITLIDVYLGLTIDCDYETPGSVEPNIGVLAVNVTFKNITGTVTPKATSSASSPVGGDPSFLTDAAGTFICLSKRMCEFEVNDVHITHADPTTSEPPVWLCNNTENVVHDVTPTWSHTCRP